jgi:micrococcal nuclease
VTGTRSALLAIGLGTALAAGCSSAPTCGPTSATVLEVVDGDTVVLDSGQRVRYILVDTPEITQGHDDCYGAEARDYNKSLVLDQKVDLTYDQVCTDRYGRLLAYLSVQGHDVNALMVERGFGCVLHIPPDGDGRLSEFQALQSQAKADGRGLWGSCTTGACF